MKILKVPPLLIALLMTIILCTATLAKPSIPSIPPAPSSIQPLPLPTIPSFPIKPLPTLPIKSSATADYVRSLFFANKFLYAWKTRSTKEGLALISPALKNKMSDQELLNYISGLSSPSHAAFEISSGEQLPDGRYSFDVKLYEYYYATTPETQSWKCPALTTIILRKSGVVDSKFQVSNWLVDELPEPCQLVLSRKK